MHRDEHTQTTTFWTSDVRPELHTTDVALADVIAWADAHPSACSPPIWSSTGVCG